MWLQIYDHLVISVKKKNKMLRNKVLIHSPQSIQNISKVGNLADVLVGRSEMVYIVSRFTETPNYRMV